MKIALVHDYLHTYGGAEKVLEALHEIYPEAPIFTALYYPSEFPEGYKTWDIRTSSLQKLPQKFHKFYKALYPKAFKEFDLSNYDVVISSTAGMAKGISLPKNTIHISYIHTVPRAVINVDNRRGFINDFVAKRYKSWDLKAAKSVDFFIANSKTVQERIKKYYKKDSVVINPPVEIENLRALADKDSKEDYFVMVGRLEKYKGPVEVATAIKDLNLKLKIIGSGPEESKLKEFEPNVKYLGRVDEKTKANVVKNAKALIFWAYEDFGITMVESLALGTPVIAFGKGGSTEFITEKNGILFKEQAVESLMEVLKNFDETKFETQAIKDSAEKYSKENFKKEIINFVNKCIKK